MVLTEEETAIAKFVVNGLKNVEIAEIMGYSEATVKKRLTVIYKKMNVFNRLQLITKFLSQNNISAQP